MSTATIIAELRDCIQRLEAVLEFMATTLDELQDLQDVPEPEPIPEPPAPAPSPCDCLRGKPVYSWRNVDGLQDGCAVDARDMTLVTGTGSGIKLEDVSDVCWQGGVIQGAFGDGWTDWGAAKTQYGMRLEDCGEATICGVTFKYLGDGLKVRGRGDHVTKVKRCRFTGCRDDAIECDDLLSFEITDCLIEGHIPFAFREYDSKTSGAGHTITIERCLVRLVPQLAVYKGRSPGHGGFFKESKLSDAKKRPKYILKNNIFVAEQLPNYGTLSLNPNGDVIESSGNIIIWPSEYPEPVPRGWMRTADTSVWNLKVSIWQQGA